MVFDVWFIAVAGTVVAYYLLDEFVPAVPIVLAVVALAYTAWNLRLRRRVEEAVEERRAELRAFIERSRAEPS